MDKEQHIRIFAVDRTGTKPKYQYLETVIVRNRKEFDACLNEIKKKYNVTKLNNGPVAIAIGSPIKDKDNGGEKQWQR